MSDARRTQESKDFGVKLAGALGESSIQGAGEHDLDARFVMAGAAAYLSREYVVAEGTGKADRSRAFGAKLGEALVARLSELADTDGVDLSVARSAAAARLHDAAGFRLNPPIDRSDLRHRDS